MENVNDGRKYQRNSNLMTSVEISHDGFHWVEVELEDLSAGGLRFRTKNKYETYIPMYFQISIHNMLSEFTVNLKGTIIRIEMEMDKPVYAANFVEVDSKNQILLDEIIKANISSDHSML